MAIFLGKRNSKKSTTNFQFAVFEGKNVLESNQVGWAVVTRRGQRFSAKTNGGFGMRFESLGVSDSLEEAKDRIKSFHDGGFFNKRRKADAEFFRKSREKNRR